MIKKQVFLDANSKKPAKTPIPEVGTEFEINGFKYIVSYINEGKKRFTSEIVIQSE